MTFLLSVHPNIKYSKSLMKSFNRCIAFFHVALCAIVAMLPPTLTVCECPFFPCNLHRHHHHQHRIIINTLTTLSSRPRSSPPRSLLDLSAMSKRRADFYLTKEPPRNPRPEEEDAENERDKIDPVQRASQEVMATRKYSPYSSIVAF